MSYCESTGMYKLDGQEYQINGEKLVKAVSKAVKFRMLHEGGVGNARLQML